MNQMENTYSMDMYNLTDYLNLCFASGHFDASFNLITRITDNIYVIWQHLHTGSPLVCHREIQF